MFSSRLRSALVALVAFAIAVSAAPGLSLKFSGPQAVDGVNNLKVIATVTNTGDETLKLLNDPRGPLSKMPTNTFAITHDVSGATPGFVGAKVKYVPSGAIKFGQDDAFTVLTPGQSASLEHDLSAAYNFTSSGAGGYTIEALNRFHFVHPETNEPVELWADAEVHSAAVSGTLAVSRPAAAGVSKRASFNGCSSSEQSQVNVATPAAHTYAANAYSYLSSHTAATTRYTTWFGAYTSSRHSTALLHFSNLNGNSYTSFTYDCTCSDSGTYAYVYPDQFGTIYLCPVFWQVSTTGTDSQAGTLIHESSHFTVNGGTQDYVYGQSGAQSLAKSNPGEAVFNADSHEYFAENNPTLP